MTYNNNELISLWLSKGGNNQNCKIITDLNTERFVDEVLNAVASEFPERIQNVDVEELKNTIILNLNTERL